MGMFGNPNLTVDDTIFQFALTNPSLSVVSATVQFAAGSSPTDFGLVLCPLDSSAVNTPCTTEQNPAVGFTAPSALSPDGSLVLTFSNFSSLYAGTGLTQGLTAYFYDASATSAFASVTSVTTSASTSATPEPASIFLLGMVAAGSLVFAVYNRRRTAGQVRE
jgi:hypothetical protein